VKGGRQAKCVGMGLDGVEGEDGDGEAIGGELGGSKRGGGRGNVGRK